MKTVISHSFKLAYFSLALLLAISGMVALVPVNTSAGGYDCPTTAYVMTTLGKVEFEGSGLCVSNPVSIPMSAVRCGLPAGFSFPYGLVYFETFITSTDGVGRIRIHVQNPLPLNVKFYGCNPNGMIDISSYFTRVNENTVILTLTANGCYTIGAAFPLNTPPQSSSSWLPEPSKAPVNLANVAVKKASISATKVAPGDTVTVTADVANTGTGNGTSLIKVYINGQEETSQGVTVASGTTTPVTFTVSRNEPGTYSVYVGGTQAGSFTVDEFTPNTILFISGALVFFALIIGVIFMTRRRV